MTKEVNNIDDYLEIVQERIFTMKQMWSEEDAPIALFRGHSSFEYKIEPSLARSIDNTSNKKWLTKESNIINEALEKCPEIFANCDSTLDILTILQHYGLPTRLLDVTEDALVALYFACREKFDIDGEVFVFNSHMLNTNHHFYKGIADTYRLVSEGNTVLAFIREICKQPYYHEDEGPINNLKDDDLLGRMIQGKLFSIPHYVFPDKLTQRQQAQNGRYIIFGNSIGRDGKFEQNINEIKKTDEIIDCIIRIPASFKKKLYKELAERNYCHEKLFPDNDIACFKEIKYQITN